MEGIAQHQASSLKKQMSSEVGIKMVSSDKNSVKDEKKHIVLVENLDIREVINNPTSKQ